jgi:DNA-directed RNA polymerase subunit omega
MRRVSFARHPRSRFAGVPARSNSLIMRDDYLQAAHLVIDDPMILVNVVSRRVKQLRQGSRPLVVSLEKLSAEDTALREIAEGKISYELGADADANHRR